MFKTNIATKSMLKNEMVIKQFWLSEDLCKKTQTTHIFDIEAIYNGRI